MVNVVKLEVNIFCRLIICFSIILALKLFKEWSKMSSNLNSSCKNFNESKRLKEKTFIFYFFLYRFSWKQGIFQIPNNQQIEFDEEIEGRAEKVTL